MRPPPSDDAVVPDPHASYLQARAAPEATPRERAIISAQIGRPSRGVSAIVHRCVFGLPTAIRVAPRLEDGTPFPTVFWQTCPVLSSAIGRLEAEGMMVGLRERLAEDDEFAATHAAQHERYVAFRDGLDAPLPGDPGAGGMPNGVKCLHVMVGHELATGDNEMGREALATARPVPCAGPCVSEDDIAHWRARAAGGAT